MVSGDGNTMRMCLIPVNCTLENCWDGSTACYVYSTTILKRWNLKKTHDVYFPFSTLNFDVNHNSALLLAPFLRQFQRRPGLGMVWVPGKGLLQRLWAPPQNAQSWRRQGPYKSRWAEMGWDRENYWVPPKSPEANSYLPARHQNQRYAAETGESLKQAGTQVLKGQFQIDMGFQNVKEVLSEMEIF